MNQRDFNTFAQATSERYSAEVDRARRRRWRAAPSRRGRRLVERDDPIRQLAAAVVHQAVLDARGEIPGNERHMESYLSAHARHWLQSGGADDFLGLLGLDAGAVCERLG